MAKTVNAMAAGVLVLAVALFMPPLIDSTSTDASQTLEIENQSGLTVTDNLRVNVDNVDTVNSKATIEATNTKTVNRTQATLNVTETRDVVLDGQTVTITLDDVRETPRGQYATATYSYPSTFGFDESAKSFLSNMPLLLSLIAFVIVMGLLGAVLRG